MLVNREKNIYFILFLGGLTREWLSLLVKEVFNPEMGLFKASENKISYQPNPMSYIVPDHLLQFRMLGRLIGKALIEKWEIEVFFVKSFLKHILRKQKKIVKSDLIYFYRKDPLYQ